jgi:hypothetical protein
MKVCLVCVCGDENVSVVAEMKKRIMSDDGNGDIL